MNINFHYFAIKTLAILAGFEDTKAQQLAKYSQFVDDYSTPSLIACSNIPRKIINSSTLDLYSWSILGNFRPVATGFTNPFEYARLIASRDQRFILSPFHFTPFDETQAGIADSSVIPLAFGDNSLIDRLLHKEIESYKIGHKQNITLMRLGMLLHIYADSYAHQMFTGFVSPTNRVNITEVINNITGENCTSQARAGIKSLFNNAATHIPAIGHTQAGHNPDLSNISFTFSYSTGNGDSNDQLHYQNNTETFLEAGRNIYSYFNKCLEGEPMAEDNTWDNIKPKLRQGFMIERPRQNPINTLAAHWQQIFPHIQYHYNSGEIRKSFRLTPTSISEMTRNAKTAFSEEFYEYNIMANEVLISLYGPRPRR